MLYNVKPGDTLSEIAKRHGVSVEAIMSINPKIKNKDLIYAGDTLFIPVFFGWWERFWQSVRDLFK